MSAKGSTQIAGLDYDETYTPVLQMSTFRLWAAQGVEHGMSFTAWTSELRFFILSA